MANPNVDDELVREYLAECREHLATIEQDLLAIEQGGEEIDEELVNRVFRAAHSIKGGAAFFDLVKIRELAHKTESVLDLIRSRQMTPTPETVSILLLAFDKLRELIDDHRESNHADIGEFTSALATLVSVSLPPDQKTSVNEIVELAAAGVVIKVSALDLNQSRKGGKCIYLIEYDLIHDIQRQGKSPLDIFRGLISCGRVLETMFDLDSAGTLDDEPSNRLMLAVLYATVLEPDLIGQLVEVPPERVHLVEKSGATRRLTETAGAPAPPPIATSAEPEMGSMARAPRAPEPNEAPEKFETDEEPASKPLPAAVRPGGAPPATKPPATAPGEATIRLSVTLLDSLMTLAGELVLSRNQLNESLARKQERGIRSGAQRISLVTSELQEVVTQTRMHRVGSLFSKFPRVVRDLAKDMGKNVELKLEGGDVELDKTILEGLSDPLTHMVRNAVDHGIEPPRDRLAQGKPPEGLVTLKASHQAGQVILEVADDGKGLAALKVANSAIAKGLVSREQVAEMSDSEKMALIFLPGVSTAEKVSDVSGRGVGMDVVKTNLDKLGGKIEIESAPGKGTRFRIKLPLTLAIIPSLLVSDGGDRFAIPQVNVSELIRIPAASLAERLDRVGDAEVLKLRDRLLPLIRLGDALGCPHESKTARAVNVVLVDTGAFEYGLAVDELHDTVEIVVKPLGRHLKGLHEYAGAAILGDGRVAVILDIGGLAVRAGLSAAKAERVTRKAAAQTAATTERHALLLFHNAPGENCAVPIEQVRRIERVKAEQIESIGGRRTIQYRGASMPLVMLSDTAAVGQLNESQRWVVITFEQMGRPVGLVAAEPLDMVEAKLDIDTLTLRQPGIAGSAVFKERTVLLLDIPELAAGVLPAQNGAPGSTSGGLSESSAKAAPATILLAEDSDFFRGQIQRLMESVGYRVVAAPDGMAAWEVLDGQGGGVDLVATDIEMPRMDGLALTRRIRADRRFAGLPVIALSSLAGEEEIARGMAAGVDEYQVKLNQEELLESIGKAIRKNPGSAATEECFSDRKGEQR